MKFNSMDVKLINAKYLHISLIKKYIDNGKNIKTIPIEDIDFKLIDIKKHIILNKPNLVNKEMTYCFELPFGILTFNSLQMLKKCVLFLLMYEYKLLCINILSLSYFLKKLRILHYLGFFKHLTEIDSDFIDTYHELKVYIAIKDYMKNVKQLKELRNLEVLRELEINETKEEAEIQLNELEIEKNKVLDNLKFELQYGSEKNKQFKRSNSYEDEIES